MVDMQSLVGCCIVAAEDDYFVVWNRSLMLRLFVQTADSMAQEVDCRTLHEPPANTSAAMKAGREYLDSALQSD